MDNHLYKIFQSIKAQKTINIIYSIIFLIGFSYYYYYHDYFKILLLASIGSLLLLFIYWINKKNISQINFKPIIHKEIKINLFKIFLIFTLISIIWININLFINSGPNLEHILKKIPWIQFNILYKIISLLAFDLIFILILWSIGSKIIKLFKLKLTNLEEFLLGFSLGAIPLIFSTFFLSITSLLYTKYILINLAIWILFSYKEIIINFKKILNLEIKLPLSQKINDYNFIKKIILIIIFISIIFFFTSSINPQPLDYDSLHTYYNVPEISLHQHKLTNFPLFPFANMPKNIEMLYINIMATMGPYFLSNIQLIYFFLTLITIYLFCKKFFNQKIGILAVLIFFSSISFSYLVTTTKIDCSLVFYSILTVYIFFNWTKKQQSIWAILLGILFGLNFGIKYNSILLTLGIGFIIIFTILKKIIKNNNYKSYFYQSLLIFIFSIIFASPWLIKNKTDFNSFLYPYYTKENSTINTIYENETKEGYADLFYQRKSNQIKNLITLPQIYLKHGSNSKLLNFSPILIIGLLLLLTYKKGKEEKNIIIISLLYIILWLNNFRLWNAIPIFPILSILISNAIIKNKIILKNKIIKILFLTYIIIFIILINTTSAIKIYYISGLISKKEYLDKIAIYQISQKLNEIIEKNEKVLLIWEMRINFIENNDKNSIINSKNEYFFNHKINKNTIDVSNMLKKRNIKYIIYKYDREDKIKNLPYGYKNNLNLKKNENYKNILKNIELFNEFKKKKLKEIDCVLNEGDAENICLYKIKDN